MLAHCAKNGTVWPKGVSEYAIGSCFKQARDFESLLISTIRKSIEARIVKMSVGPLPVKKRCVKSLALSDEPGAGRCLMRVKLPPNDVGVAASTGGVTNGKLAPAPDEQATPLAIAKPTAIEPTVVALEMPLTKVSIARDVGVKQHTVTNASPAA